MTTCPQEDDCGWLIETGDRVYWTGKTIQSFSPDANEAVWFLRKVDADRVIFWLLKEYSIFLVARQHKMIG